MGHHTKLNTRLSSGDTRRSYELGIHGRDPARCGPEMLPNLVNSITTIDKLLKISRLRGPLKKLFGLGGLESDQDFVSVLTVCPLCCVTDDRVE